MIGALSAAFSGVALLVSVVVFVDNRRRALESARLQRRPALVFAWDHERQHWEVINIGSGPALDLVIVQRIEREWTLPLRMPELAVNGRGTVPRRWLEQRHPDPGLAARYRSVAGEPYMTVTGNDVSTISEGWGDLPPKLWEDVEPHWRYRRTEAAAGRT
jgi:hypothetical protein